MPYKDAATRNAARLARRDRINAKWNQNRAANPDKYAQIDRKKLLKRYGLTLERYNEMVEEQNGACFLCHMPKPGQKLNVDHDHETGLVRKLLCTWCNVGLGFLENPAWRQSAEEYITRFKGNQMK